MAVRAWNVQLFGTLRAKREAQVIERFQTRKTGALFGYLVAQDSPRPRRREELIDMFWPDADNKSGRNRLRIALTDLRSHFELPGEETLIYANHQTVHLLPNAFRTDKSEFEALLQRAHAAMEEETRADNLTKAVELYRGELLPGYEEEWIAGERQRLADSYLMALRRLIKYHTEAHHHETALDYARRALETDPYREESHRTLMRLLVITGQRGAALRQYYELERILQEGLGTVPSALTRELAEQIISIERSPPSPVVTASPPAPSPLRPAHAPHPEPGTLPAPLTKLYGRDQDITAVIAMLETPETRLVTLTGPGGCGKTRLALAVAARLQPASGGAVWYLPLADLRDPERILEEVVRALCLPSAPHVPPLIQIRDALRHQETLLVFDNFEHLVEAGAMHILALLEHIPTLRCLITSRQRLNLSGEYERAVHPLPLPPETGSWQRLATFASVQLFVDRAQAVRSSFRLYDHVEGVGALCRALDGLPLALELAASWVHILTPEQILQRLSSRFKLLVNSQKSASARHASLRATLDWSYDLLALEIQQTFTHLAVFRGGFTLEAAEAVSATPDTLAHLIQLRERSLLLAEEVGKAMRYRLLETVREYSRERLETNDGLAVRQRHTAFFLCLAEEADSHLRGPSASTWLDILEREHDNLRAALENADTISGLRLAAVLHRFWYIHDYMKEGGEHLHRTLDNYPEAPSELRARAHMGAGNLAYGRGDMTTASHHFNEALALRREVGDKRGIAGALGSLGNIAKDTDDFAVAETFYLESLSLSQSIADERGIALTRSNLAIVRWYQGALMEALTLEEKAISHFRITADNFSMAHSLANQATILLSSVDYAQARPILTECLFLSQKLQSTKLMAQCLCGWASLLSLEKDADRAIRLYGVGDALRTSRHIELPPRIQTWVECICNRLQEEVGAERYKQLFAEGRAMTKEQALALIQNPGVPPSKPPNKTK